MIDNVGTLDSPRRELRWWQTAVALICLLVPGPVWPARLSVVVDGSEPHHSRVAQALMTNFAAENAVQVHNLDTADFSSPIAKGRFLAQVAAADLVIPVGDAAVQLVSYELEDLKAFFVSGGTLSEEYLGQRHVSGILSYSPGEILNVAKSLLPRLKIVGILYRPGYEDVIERFRSAASGAGLSILARRIESRSQIGGATREAVNRADFLWIPGDAPFFDDLAFSYLVSESLRMKKAVATPVPSMVEKGALFRTIPDPEKMANLASSTLAELLTAQFRLSGADRVKPAPPGGSVKINDRLADKLGITIPASLRISGGVAP